MSYSKGIISSIYTLQFLFYNKVVALFVGFPARMKRGGLAVYDNFVHLIMQILTIVVIVGTLGVSFLVGAIWRKQKGY